jgi:hypothetical protein
VAASLPRALTIVSLRIYKNETTNSGTSQYLPEHLFSNLVYKARTRVALPRARGGAAGATANAAVEQGGERISEAEGGDELGASDDACMQSHLYV